MSNFHKFLSKFVSKKVRHKKKSCHPTTDSNDEVEGGRQILGKQLKGSWKKKKKTVTEIYCIRQREQKESGARNDARLRITGVKKKEKVKNKIVHLILRQTERRGKKRKERRKGRKQKYSLRTTSLSPLWLEPDEVRRMMLQLQPKARVKTKKETRKGGF